MENRVGIITGCGKGIGLATTEKLLSTDDKVIIYGISRSHNSNIDILKKIFGSRFNFFKCNIDDTKGINNLIDEIYEKNKRLNFAICNAGIRSRLNLLESNLDLYRKVFEINTISNINIAKKLIKINLAAQSSCNILFISSIVGSRGFDELSTYAVSKSALEGFMRSAAIEYAKEKIQLNCLAPGFVESSYSEDFKKNKTDLYDWTIAQTPMGRWGKCEEIAEMVSFLISEQNSYMTGSVIYTDGGWTAK